MTTTDALTAKAAKRAASFASAARRDSTNVVTETTETARLFDWMPLARTYRVEVTDRLGRVTVGSWSVQVEAMEAGRRRSIRFHGWGFSAWTKGEQITEGLARIRVTN